MDMNQDNKAIKAITDLLETAKDGMKGYETAAESVENPQVKAELSRLSQQRAAFVNELESCANQFGFSANQNTTVESVAMDAAGAVHRGWINLKSAITGNSSQAILSECENGDAAALKTYEEALSNTSLPTEVRNVVEKQHSEILEAKNRVTMLKQQV
ncbi:ferritin-like domain-containing protein [Adhaeribacter aquaticus]|uniref:ferritin-like domain-containing protein n=1 Tax=Adhaeribacter aquaticus TaxID=299567 RepID=UPI0003FD7068|nr:PA2169 family four-helix-bundle protein [Adhaeribacter aquaticus]